MPKPESSVKSSFNPLRLVSPAMLTFCLFLFFLPWVELQCVPHKLVKDASKERLESIKKETGADAAKPMSLISQSGFDIATGNAVFTSDFKKVIEKSGDNGQKVEVETKRKEYEKETGGVPILYLYPLVLVAGAVVGCAVPAGLVRRLSVLGCCLVALGCVGIPAAVGFPLDQNLGAFRKGMAATEPAPPGGRAEPRGPAPIDLKAVGDSFRVSWQLPLYLTFLLVLGAAGAAFLDGGSGKGPSGRNKRRGDDADEEKEGDRPRKKSRRGDEDDYDRPKKKRRDDEDDRSRKKAPPEPEFEMPGASAPLAAPDPAPAAGGANPFDFDSQEQPRKKPRRDERDEEEDERPSKKRRRDEEEDEDDRPRKKSRRDDDEEDDRPRKKKAPPEPEFEMPTEAPPPPPAAPAGPNPFAFDDDEPAPKKKPRRRDDDDDDDDDRPRKKRRRDDDD